MDLCAYQKASTISQSTTHLEMEYAAAMAKVATT